MAPGDCCIPPPPANYEGKGKEETWDGIPVYAIGSPTSSSAVLFICDIYGWRVPQTRYLVDKIAAHGHYVLVPDVLRNDFFTSPNPKNQYEGLPDYLARHSQPVAIDDAAHVIKQLRTKRKGVKVGVVGNCWGAKITIGLLRGDKGVDAAAMMHPSFLTKEEIRAVKVPLAILGASLDTITPPEVALEFGQILAASTEVGDKSYVKIFEGVDHGWSTRYDLEDEIAQQKATAAHDEVLVWLAKYLA